MNKSQGVEIRRAKVFIITLLCASILKVMAPLIASNSPGTNKSHLIAPAVRQRELTPAHFYVNMKSFENTLDR